MEVDVLKAELHKSGRSTSGKKVKPLEKLKKAMIEKIPLTAEIICSLAPNDFIK